MYLLHSSLWTFAKAIFMKRVFFFLVLSLALSCEKNDQDVKIALAKSLDGKYALSGIDWNGEPFDWNGDGIASFNLEEEFNEENNSYFFVGGDFKDYMMYASSYFTGGGLNFNIPVQQGDTVSYRLRGVFPARVNAHGNYSIVKHDGNYDVECSCDEKDLQLSDIGHGRRKFLSKYTDGSILYNDGKFILSYDAVFFDPVSWKDVTGKIAFTYAIKPEK